MKTLEFAVSALKKRGLSLLKSSFKGWVHSKKCRANVTIFRETKKNVSTGTPFIISNSIGSFQKISIGFKNTFGAEKKRPNKKFRLLYEWAEDEIDASWQADEGILEP